MSKSEQALEELLTVYHIPCIKVRGFDFLIKFSNEYFFVEHKKAFLNKRCWVTMAHIPAIEYQIKVAKRFGFKTLLIVDIPLKGLFMADLDKFNNRALTKTQRQTTFSNSYIANGRLGSIQQFPKLTVSSKSQ